MATPARMKQGTASSGKESMPPIRRWGAVIMLPPSMRSQAIPMKIKENATGMLAATSVSQATK